MTRAKMPRGAADDHKFGLYGPLKLRRISAAVDRGRRVFEKHETHFTVPVENWCTASRHHQYIVGVPKNNSKEEADYEENDRGGFF